MNLTEYCVSIQTKIFKKRKLVMWMAPVARIFVAFCNLVRLTIAQRDNFLYNCH